jgi:hypothetical protein
MPVNTASAPIRVASVPAAHTYVRHLSHPDGADAIVRLPDPQPTHGRLTASPMVDPEWILAHRRSFDVFHLHLGDLDKSPTELEDVALALRIADVPLVLTVHELHDRTRPDDQLRMAQLNVLTHTAAVIVTLTEGAAAVIASEWERSVAVLCHPHLIDVGALARPRAACDTFLIGVYGGDLGPNVDVATVVSVLADVVEELPGARLRVDIEDQSQGEASDDVRAALRVLASRDGAEIFQHRPLSGETLSNYILGLDALVLPNRYGTHSGLLEACNDLGTIGIAPTCGFYTEQRPCLSYQRDEHGLNVHSLAEAAIVAYDQRPAWRSTADQRLEERRWLADTHRIIYEQLVA